MIYKRYRNADGVDTALDYLDKIIGADGVKTDINVKVPATVFIYTGVALFVGIVGAILVARKLKK